MLASGPEVLSLRQDVARSPSPAQAESATELSFVQRYCRLRSDNRNGTVIALLLVSQKTRTYKTVWEGHDFNEC